VEGINAPVCCSNGVDDETVHCFDESAPVITTAQPTKAPPPSITPSLSPSMAPTVRPTEAEKIECCHAFAKRYERRCNFMTGAEICTNGAYGSICFWSNDENCLIHESVQNNAKKCYCTAQGIRKKVSCQKLTKVSDCLFSGCDWECSDEDVSDDLNDND
jgi:hypothetical protein